MKKTLFFVLLAGLMALNFANAQYINTDKSDLSLRDLTSPPPTTAVIDFGAHAGFAYFDDKTGFAIGLFAEINIDKFSIVPQANYWTNNKTNNFEMAALLRLNFKSATSNAVPYIDGGVGINFYKGDSQETKPSLDLGAGIIFLNALLNMNIFIDGKYKIIIRDGGNVKGYTLTAGVKFPL